MKTKFEVDMDEGVPELFDQVTLFSLLQSLETLKNPMGIPFFSNNPKEEAKQLKKMIKSFKQVIGWYSAPGDKYYE
jgi:hypothetical protein